MKYFLSIMSFFLIHSAVAESFPIYVVNETPYSIHLGKSYYNETPLNLTVTEILPHTAQVKVGEGEIMTERAAIVFYARVGEEESYWNTPLIKYQFQPFIFHAKVDPQNLLLENKPYAALAQFNRDLGPRAIVLVIRPIDNYDKLSY